MTENDLGPSCTIKSFLLPLNFNHAVYWYAPTLGRKTRCIKGIQIELLCIKTNSNIYFPLIILSWFDLLKCCYRNNHYPFYCVLLYISPLFNLMLHPHSFRSWGYHSSLLVTNYRSSPYWDTIAPIPTAEWNEICSFLPILACTVFLNRCFLYLLKNPRC